MAGEIKVAVQRFTMPGTTEGTGTQDYTISGLGWTPKAALLLATPAYAAANPSADAYGCCGFAISTTERACCSFLDENGVADSDTGRLLLSANCLSVRNDSGAGNVRLEADFSAWIANGIRLNWTTVEGTSTNKYFMVVFFGGADLQASIDIVTLSTQDTPRDETGPGFEPDLLFLTGHGATSSASDNANLTSNLIHTLGVCANTAGTPQFAHAWAHSNGVATSAPTAFQWSDGAAGQTFAGSETWRCLVSDFDANGYTLTAKDGNSSGDEVAVLALGTDTRKVWVGGLDFPTSGSLVTTDPGFKPQAYGLIGGACAARDTFETDADAGVFCFGATDGTREATGNFSVEDNQTTMDTQMESRTDSVLSAEVDSGASTLYRAAHSTFDTNGFTATVSTHPGTARKIFGWAIEEESAGISASVGQVSEADTALAITVLKTLSVAQASEPDVSIFLTAVKTLAIGQPSETDVSIFLGVAKALTVGQPSETDSALAVTATGAVLIGQPSETDSALAMTVLKTVSVGQASEADSALAVTLTGAVLVAQASETDVSLPLTVVKTLAVGQPSGIDLSLPVTVAKGVDVGQASETDSVLAMSVLKVLAAGQAAETDSALAVGGGIVVVPTAPGVEWELTDEQAHWSVPDDSLQWSVGE